MKNISMLLQVTKTLVFTDRTLGECNALIMTFLEVSEGLDLTLLFSINFAYALQTLTVKLQQYLVQKNLQQTW